MLNAPLNLKLKMEHLLTKEEIKHIKQRFYPSNNQKIGVPIPKL